MGVGEDLRLDMSWGWQVALEDHPVVAEGAGGFASGGLERLGEIILRVHHAHALAAAAGRGLEHQRKADALGFGHERVVGLVVAVVARNQRHVGGFHFRLGGGLGAHQVHGLGRGADQGQAGIAQGAREIGVLGQETVAGMDGLCIRFLRRGDDAFDVQVGLARRRGADVHGAVGQADVPGVGIGVGIDGHGLHAQVAAGGDDAAGDLASVGNQDSLEHGHLKEKWSTDEHR